MKRSEFATNIYVVGEVLISVIALVGALAVLFFSGDQDVKLTASGLLSAITVFWFSRRAAEQSNNNLTMLANGKLTQLLEAQSMIASNQQAQVARTDGLVSLMARLTSSHEAAIKSMADTATELTRPSTGKDTAV